MRGIFILLWLITGFVEITRGQSEDALIRKGNRAYQKKELDKSKAEYRKALEKSPQNPVAHYNLGNAEFRENNFEEAGKSYGEAISHTEDKSMQEKGYYNQGLTQIKQKQLEEGIKSWENALKIDPNDQEARENLEKALRELRAKQPPPSQDNKKDKEKQKQKQDQKQDQKKEQKPEQQPSKLTKQQVEQLLKALEQKEKEVQDKVNQNKVKSLSQPEKDW